MHWAPAFVKAEADQQAIRASWARVHVPEPGRRHKAGQQIDEGSRLSRGYGLTWPTPYATGIAPGRITDQMESA